MRFQGRDHDDRDSTWSARRPGRVFRLVPKHPLGGTTRLETLESRVLLSGTSQANVISLPLLTFPLPPAIMVPLAVDQDPISGTTTTVEGASFHLSSIEQTISNPDLSGTGGGGPLVTVMRTIHTSPESTAGMMIVSNPSSGDVGQDEIAPVIVLAPGFEGPPPSQQAAIPVDYGAPLGIGATDQQEPASPLTGPMPATYSSDESASIPYDKRVDLEGSIDATDGSMSVQIPVGPLTKAVGVSVHPDLQGNPADAPVLAELSLLDKDGDILAQVTPVWNPQTNSPTDAVTVSLSGAPVGGTLVVQISTPGGASATTAAASSNAPLATGMTVPFMMDVQRVEAAGSGNYGEVGSLVGGQASLGRARIGTLAPTANWPMSNSGATTTTAESTLSGPESAVLVDQGNLVPAGDEFDTEAETPPDFSGRIATGPLASRSASPLGPNLVTVSLDQTPVVDRHERGLAREIEDRESEADDMADASSGRNGRLDDSLAPAGTRRGPAESDRDEGTHVAIAGLGALPLKVPSRGNDGRGGDLGALLAALPGSAGQEGSPAVVAGEDHSLDDLSSILVSPASSAGDGRPAPDYLTAACALVLGMGLTTGPLLPDLLRLIPTRSARWHIVPAGAARFFGGSRSRNRTFGEWLRKPPASTLRREDS